MAFDRRGRTINRPSYKASAEKLENENRQLYETLERHLKEIETLRDLNRQYEKRIEFLSSTDAQDELLDQLSKTRDKLASVRRDNDRLRKLAEALFPLAVQATPLIEDDVATETGDWA